MDDWAKRIDGIADLLQSLGGIEQFAQQPAAYSVSMDEIVVPFTRDLVGGGACVGVVIPAPSHMPDALWPRYVAAQLELARIHAQRLCPDVTSDKEAR